MRFPFLSVLTPRRLLRPASSTVRLRLTLFYSALFLISGAALLAITYVLVRHATQPSVVIRNVHGGGHRLTGSAANRLLSKGSISQRLSALARHAPGLARQARAQSLHDHAAELHQLLVQSGIALAIMTVLSVALGWLVAGRVLRPLRTITATTQRISERNLHERLALDGPHDELRDLADTVDGLLSRLETAFDAQKRFVANAAHELRTPLTLLRALLEETLSDPTASVESFRATSQRLLALGQDQEQLLEALLMLASSERGLDRRSPLDLAVIADTVLLDSPPDVERLGVRIRAAIKAAPARGDAALIESLISNLVDNAVHHNVEGGTVNVCTGIDGDRAFVQVTNTGPVVPAAELEQLFEPFRRLGADRTARSDGHHGLGLSIVRAVATVHSAAIATRARAEGGLELRVSFPLLVSDDLGDGSPTDGQPHGSVTASMTAV